MQRAFLTVVLACGLTGCEPLEFRIDQEHGVPSLSGQYTVSLGSFTCGEPLEAEGYTVTTTVVAGGCRFSFSNTLEVLSASHYENIGELKKAANLVQRIELKINQLAFTDGGGNPLNLSTQVTEATLSVNGQQVADKQGLSSLPIIVELSGSALNSLKSQIDKGQPASVSVTAEAVLPDDPPPPETLTVSYDAQPAVIVGPGEVTIF